MLHNVHGCAIEYTCAREQREAEGTNQKEKKKIKRTTKKKMHEETKK